MVSQRLCQLPGVSQVGVYGGAKTAVRVQVNPAALAAMGMSTEDAPRVSSEHEPACTAKGSIEDAGKNLMISANDQIFGASNYRSLVVAERNGLPVQLGAIASVIDGTENTRQARTV